MLRTVLARLDVRLIPIERRRLRSFHGRASLPGRRRAKTTVACLSVGATGDVEVVRSHQRDQEAKSTLPRVSGEVYLIRLDKTDRRLGGHVFGGFVGEVLRAAARAAHTYRHLLRSDQCAGPGSVALHAAGLRSDHCHRIPGYAGVPGIGRARLPGPRPASSPGAIRADRLSRGALRRGRVGAGLRVRAQPSPLADGAGSARLPAVALSPIRGRPRPVCRQSCIGDFRPAVHAAVHRPAVRDRRVAGICADWAFAAHDRRLRAGRDSQHRPAQARSAPAS